MWEVKKRGFVVAGLAAAILLVGVQAAIAQQEEAPKAAQPPAVQPPPGQAAPPLLPKIHLLYVANQGANTLSVIDVVALKTLSEISVKGQFPHDVAVTATGQYVFTANLLSGDVSVIDTATESVLDRIVACKACQALALTPDEKELWVVDVDGNRLVVIGLTVKAGESFPIVARIPTGEAPGYVLFSQDGKRAYVSIQKAGVVEVYDTASRSKAATIPVGKNPTALRLSPDGKQLWVANSGGDDLTVIDTATNRQIATVTVGPQPHQLYFVERGARGLFAYVTVGGKNEVALVDVAARQVVERIPVGETPVGIWGSEDQRFVFVGHKDTNQIFVIETGTNLTVVRLQVGKQPVAVLAKLVSPSCSAGACPILPEQRADQPERLKLLYVGDQGSNKVTVIDAGKLRPLIDVDIKGKSPNDFEMMIGGQFLFVANRLTGDVEIIDTTTFQTAAQIPNLCKQCEGLALTPVPPKLAEKLAALSKELWVVDSGDNKVVVVNISGKAAAPFQVVDRIGTGKTPGHIAFGLYDKDGNATRAYVAIQEEGTVEVFDVESRKKVATIPVGQNPTYLHATPDRKQVWGTNTGDDSVFVIDAETNQRIATVEVGPKPKRLHFVNRGPAGLAVYVSVSGSDEVVVVDAKEMKVVSRIPVGKIPNGIWASDDEKQVFVCNEGSDDLYVIDTSGDLILARIPVGKKPTAVLAAIREPVQVLGCTFGEVCPLDFMQARVQPKKQEDVQRLIARLYRVLLDR